MYFLQLIEQNGSPTQFLDASNRFYTLIPHDFGMKKPPLLDTADAIRVCFLLILTTLSALKMLVYCSLCSREAFSPQNFEFWLLWDMLSVLWRCWLCGRKGIRPVKKQWWGAGVVICLEQGADLRMALPLTVSCFCKIQIGFTLLVPAHVGSPGKRAVKRVCVYVVGCTGLIQKIEFLTITDSNICCFTLSFFST